MMQWSTKKTGFIAVIGIFSGAAIICGYIENLIPFFFGVPGVKLGLANIMTVMALYLFGEKEAAAVSLIRITVVGLLFGNMYSVLYSLAGGIASLFFMMFLKRISKLSIVGISMAGGVMHNIAQIVVAALVVEELKLVYYIPVLMIAGVLTGMLNGLLSKAVCTRLHPVLVRN